MFSLLPSGQVITSEGRTVPASHTAIQNEGDRTSTMPWSVEDLHTILAERKASQTNRPINSLTLARIYSRVRLHDGHASIHSALYSLKSTTPLLWYLLTGRRITSNPQPRHHTKGVCQVINQTSARFKAPVTTLHQKVMEAEQAQFGGLFHII